jgi:hypothetical protein
VITLREANLAPDTSMHAKQSEAHVCKRVELKKIIDPTEANDQPAMEKT